MTRGHILVVEDDAAMRETLKELLEIEGYCVFTAENGREGLRMIEGGNQPSLILLDLMMPVMSGWEFLAALKSDYPSMLTAARVAIVSAAAEVSDVQRLYGCPVLQKPLDIARLLSLARTYCATS